jgi:hypothetical protein
MVKRARLFLRRFMTEQGDKSSVGAMFDHTTKVGPAVSPNEITTQSLDNTQNMAHSTPLALSIAPSHSASMSVNVSSPR